MWLLQVAALFLLGSASSLEVVDVVDAAESCLALLGYCYHHTQDLGGSSMREYKYWSRGVIASLIIVYMVSLFVLRN